MWLQAITVFALIVSSVPQNTLDLAGLGIKREDFFLRLQKTINLAKVTNLILRDNKFDNFVDCSTNLTSLKYLDLSQNHLQQFFFLCQDEYNLNTLNVSRNKLQYITHDALNHRIPNLKVLDLSSNELSFVNETMLEHFEVLTYLSLANNPMNDGIHMNAFSNLKQLQYLSLSNVSLSYVSVEMFKPLVNLSTLDLSRNPIRTIPTLPSTIVELDLSNTMITQLNNISLPDLQELKLNDMRNLEVLCFDDLENLPRLKILSLTGSKKLAHLTSNRYDERRFPPLMQLSVNNCSLRTLDHSFLWIIKRMPILNFDGNPWNCDCRMKWIKEDGNKTLSRNIKCYTPERHRGKRLSEVPEDDLECEGDSTVFYPVLWACIMLLIVAFVLAMGFFFLRRPIGAWSIDRNRDTVRYTNVDASSTDMVRILPGGETCDRNGE
ncbi:uncharacterized protein LOC117217805 [Megalopta genalis]|uniref:uncharacterized protein LOC117217805 n=1 Tax=Megalopta genalis TaxID=115081 RepID=UPI003FCFD473